MGQLAQPAGQSNGVLGTAAERATDRRVVDRLTFGFTRYERDLLRSQGLDGYIRAQLHPASIDDHALDAFLAENYPTLAMTAGRLGAMQPGEVSNQLIRARLMRALFSRRQLFERVVECWTDHFNIWIREYPCNFLKTVDDRDVIRAHALGTFPALLRASAHSPAMLAFLNNDTNRVGAPNENYARELMELHTLSVDGGYTQADVVEVARCFTGWTTTSASGPTQHQFQFVAAQHDAAQKVVLGQLIPARAGASGQQDGEDVLNILANHASTRAFVATRLLRNFYSHTPPQSEIDAVAQIYTDTDGDIPAMLLYILHLSVGLDAPMKFKRPLHLLVSALRALGARVTSPNSLQNPLAAAGHVPFNWQGPDGYPDTLEAWAGGMLARWNFGASLMNSGWGSTTARTDVFALHEDTVGTASTADGVVDAIDASLFNNTMPSRERDELLAYLIPADKPSATRIREVLGMAVALPGFQWY